MFSGDAAAPQRLTGTIIGAYGALVLAGVPMFQFGRWGSAHCTYTLNPKAQSKDLKNSKSESPAGSPPQL